MATFSGFSPAVEDARELPKLNCIGFVGSIGEGTITATKFEDGKAKPNYVMNKIVIEPTQGGKKAFVNLLYRPEMLRPGFNPQSLKAEEFGSSLYGVYSMHIAGSRGVSTLAGIAGSEENFGVLAGRIQQAIEGIDDGDVPAAVTTVLQEFVGEFNPEVGYFSGQKMEDSGEKKPNGTKLKRPVAGQREVVGYFHPGPDADRRNLADAQKGKSVMAYSAE